MSASSTVHYREACSGHESLLGSAMGRAVYCDGTCEATECGRLSSRLKGTEDVDRVTCPQCRILLGLGSTA